MTVTVSPAPAATPLPPTRRRARRLPLALGAVVALLVGYTVWSVARPYTMSVSTEIDATPEEVWAVLADLPAYQEWNPFIVSAEGTVVEGETLDLRLRDAGGEMSIDPTVRAAEPGEELRWLGRIGPGWLFDGEHRFVIEALDDGGVRLTQSEEFRGVVVPFYRGSLHDDTLPAFEAMNQALAERVTAVRAARP